MKEEQGHRAPVVRAIGCWALGWGSLSIIIVISILFSLSQY